MTGPRDAETRTIGSGDPAVTIPHEVEVAFRTRDSLLAIARVVGGAGDTTEALRLVCRELARLTGAETVGAHLLDRERDELRPVAGYHVPAEARALISAHPVPRQPFWPALAGAGEVVWSDDVPGDERFAFALFRAVPHQSGAVVPLLAEGQLAGTLYLVWWKQRRPIDPAEAAMLQAVGQLVALLLRHARLVEEAELRRRAAEAAEEQLRNLGNNLPDGVIYQVVRRPDGTNYFPYMSSGLDHLFGATVDEALRDAGVVYRLVVPEDLVRIRAAADESIRTGEPFQIEYRLVTPEGTHRWFHLRARPTSLADGSTLWDAVALDVTDRKRAEERLRERETQLRRSEARYRLIFERTFVGIFRTRRDGILLDCNDAFARILGYAGAAEMRGRSVIPHYASPADREGIVARIAAGEEVVDAELTGRRVDGSLVPVAMSVRRIVERDGVVHEGILIDLTDRKRAEESTALRSVAELANAASHEINNPLTIVLGQLALLEKGRTAPGAIERARAAALRIRDIVRHMTRITRLERSEGWSPSLPPMLDLRRSGGGDESVDASRP
jgi:PAS domain S-box-containing protein